MHQTDNLTNKTLLLFSIGPVQDFIAAARSTRDLWSGSYLLSTLCACALKELKSQSGEVIFPSIEGQPLIDGLPENSDNEHQVAFLTPTLPNRFLAVIPKKINANEAARNIESAVRNELATIATSVRSFIKNKASNTPFLSAFDADRFDEQVSHMLEFQWQTLEVPENSTELKKLVTLLPEDSDGKYEPRKYLAEAELDFEKGWGCINSIIAWLHDGVKSHRSFGAWRQGTWQAGKSFNKDSLTGKEEAVITVDSLTKDQQENLEKFSRDIGLNQTGFKPGELLGASTLIKRIWDTSYLPKIIGVKDGHRVRQILPMPNTHQMATGENNQEDDGKSYDSESSKYFAILAMDGDEMGKWISGQKFGRAITPNDHAKFSQRLNEFALTEARALVEDSAGLLIYAGGDDVLAMIPAEKALNCAQDLREGFRNCFAKDGLAMDASVGVAIAHFMSPLQDVVKAAMAAEKRAKRSRSEGGHGRGAIAISIFKRSGEILEWGSKWSTDGDKDSPTAGIQLLRSMVTWLSDGKLSARFPHKVEALLTAYLPQSSSIAADETFENEFGKVIELEINHCLKRSGGGSLTQEEVELFKDYWEQLGADSTDEIKFEAKLQRFINILRTAAWMTRTKAAAQQAVHQDELITTL